MRELKTPLQEKNPACTGESEQRGKKWNQKIRQLIILQANPEEGMSRVEV